MADGGQQAGIMGILEPISRFLATHGLAVFLVVYYAIWVLPESDKERKTWIQEITQLRASIDPDNRPLTTAQALVILESTLESYMNYVSSEVSREVHSARGGYPLIRGWSSGGDATTLQLYNGEEIELRFNEPFKNELDRVVPQLNRIMRQEKEVRLAAFSRSFDEATPRAQASAGRLSIFAFQNKTLYDYWSEYLAEHAVAFKNGLNQELVGTSGDYATGQVRQFLRRHPKADYQMIEQALPSDSAPDSANYRSKMKQVLNEKVRKTTT